MTKSRDHESPPSLEGVLLTKELLHRPVRSCNYQLESQVLNELADAFSQEADLLLQLVVKSACKLCRGDSACISVMEESNGKKSIHWGAHAGPWEPDPDAPIPLKESLGGFVLESQVPQLFSQPQRYYVGLKFASPPLEEVLVVPFSIATRSAGALWVVSHTPSRHFDREDVRLLQGLSRFAGHALQLKQTPENDRQGEVEHNAAIEANAKFRAFFEQGSYFAGVMTLDGTLIEANRLSLEKCGFRREDVIGRKFWDCGWWNKSKELQEMIRLATQQAAQGKEFRKESSYFLADGTVRQVDFILTPVKDEAGNVIYLAPTGTDITDRKQSEQTKSRLAAIVETSDDAIISKDLNSIITSWNAGATRLFGYEEKEMIGKSITLLIPEDRIDEEPGILDRIRRGERIDHYETIRRRKNGSLVEISLSVSPVSDEAGNIVGASKIARNITDRKEYERTLIKADRQKNEFLATLAHELRNPLAPIRNALNVLKLTKGETLATERVHEMMERQVNQMVRLVDDLLEIARITTGKIELRTEPVDIRLIISNAVETSKPLIDAGGHTFEISLPASPLIVDGDPVRLSQVVSNLLNNAAKYTRPGGLVRLHVSREDKEVVISVRDNGIGIAPEHLPHVLEMFTQSERARRQSRDGLGIGLALARRLVEMHNGKLVARSEGEGKGSEFVVRLPLSPSQTRISEQLQERPAATGKLQKILVIDDNQDVASSLAILLRILGNEVAVVNSGTAALQTFEKFQPSIIFLDLGMPEMDGFEVASRLRDLPAFHDVTLIALTGWGQEDDRRRTREAGFHHHVVKPLNLEKLQSLLGTA